MESIKINTGLDNFLLIDSIIKMNEKYIIGFKKHEINDIAFYLESAAQLCSLHVRWLIGLIKQSFLLKISDCEIEDIKISSSEITVDAQLISKSEKSYQYIFKIFQDEKIVLSGNLIIATVDYNNQFNKEIIQNHYKKVFSCLLKNTPKE